MERGNRYRKHFISVEKYRRLEQPICKNCKQGCVTGGAKREEAKRVSNCGYCNGSGNKVRKQIPIEIIVD